MDTKLAIIIPTYDSLPTLKTLVGNILDYTSGEYRVYIVEDGQKKDTIKWLKQLVKKHSNFKAIFHKENKGVAPSWNDGLREAVKDNCTHFAIFNDDIEIPRNWWEDCQGAFAIPHVHLVGLNAPCPVPLTGWFFILDKKCLDKVGYFDEQFVPYCCEDDDYFIRYRNQGYRFVQANIQVFHHSSKTIGQKDKETVRAVRLNNWRKLSKKHPGLTLIAL